jgi:excisionase family DNA binding protein
MTDLPEILTLEEAAKLLRVSTKTLVKRAREGKVRGQQLAGPGSPWRFARSAVMEAVNGSRAA